SQVQRYLSGKSTKESKLGLVFNGLLKIPMQVFILFCGVMVFVFYQFNPAPIHFNKNLSEKMSAAGHQEVVADYTNQLRTLETEKKKFRPLLQKDSEIRENYKKEIQQNLQMEEDEVKDTDYVFLVFILDHLPHGLIGLLIAVILSAAMSSTAGELSALASTGM